MKKTIFIFISLAFLRSAYSGDALIVDPAGVSIFSGTAPATAPSASEVKIGGGDVQIGRTTQAVGAQVVRGDDQRINAGSVKAWVNFDGKAAAVTIRGSFNVSSVERLGTGQYKVNFSTPFASDAYVPIIMCGPEAMTSYFSPGGLTTTSVSFVCINGPLALTNASIITVAVMGF